MSLARAAHAAGVKHGVIQDKLFLPGFAKLLFVRNAGFFGRILSIRVDAGSWIFDGKTQECQRPSWNYKRAEGGGIALDMMAHWRYMIDRLAAPVTGVCAMMATAIPDRVDEHGRTYTVDVEDTSHALLQLEGGAVGVITNSWATRIRRDDTVVQMDGTLGSAVAGRFRCFTQPAVITPEAFFGGGDRRGWILPPSGRRFRTRYRPPIPSGSVGRRSCAMSPRTRPTAPILWKGRRPCSLPIWPIAVSLREGG
jgi:predicted dehydrogenase